MRRHMLRGGGLAGMVALLSACDADQATRELVTERDRLAREIAGYQVLDDVLRRGLVQHPEEIVLSVTDTLMRRLLQAPLPVQLRIPGDVDVNLQSLDLAFMGNVVQVSLQGTVARTAFPRVAAQLTMHGGLTEFHTDSAHTLSARLRIDRADVRTPSGVPNALGGTATAMLQNIVDRALPQISRSLPGVVIPVRLDRALALPGFGDDGTVAVEAAHSALTITVPRLVTFQHRLLVVVRVSRGPLQGATPTRTAAR